jgi:hypothetical protein
MKSETCSSEHLLCDERRRSETPGRVVSSRSVPVPETRRKNN